MWKKEFSAIRIHITQRIGGEGSSQVPTAEGWKVVYRRGKFSINQDYVNQSHVELQEGTLTILTIPKQPQNVVAGFA